jgi:hypothetical protein
MLSSMVGVSSTYGHFSVQRVLFEDREDKRESSIGPDIGATDLFGALMPSFSVVGPGATQLLEPLEDAVTDLEPHEDAPELAVRVPIENYTDAREAHVEATQAVCQAKGLQTDP